MKDKASGAWSAMAIRNAVAARRVSAENVVRDLIARIAVREPIVHAWERFAPDLALEQACSLDAALAAGATPGVLAGVPLGVKEIFDTANLPNVYGTSAPGAASTASDADCVAGALAAGAVMMGKTATTGFAYLNPGHTANPRNPARTPGGSSSGSAAAVADGMVPIAFGTQTAGSLIRPASYCGVFALKPTYGKFSLRGARGFAPSLDTLGWMARTANDLELVRCALAGFPFQPLATPAVGDLRLGVCRTHEWSLVDAGGVQAWHEGLRRLAAAGVRTRDIQLPPAMSGLRDAQSVVMAHEAAVSFEREWREQAGQLGAALTQLIAAGHGVDAQTYVEAQKLAIAGRICLADAMLGLDGLLVPSATGEAPEGLDATGDPAFNRVWTLLGLPCVNVPGLKGPSGMPIGMQLIGHPSQERLLLTVADCLHRILAEPTGHDH